MLWEDLAPALQGSRVEAMAVGVEEAAGQRCWYERAVDPDQVGLVSWEVDGNKGA